MYVDNDKPVMARRTKADAQVTRHQILDAAEAVFRSRGVARTCLQDVAAEAGVTRGAIYWHFKDKAEIFGAMMDRVLLPCEMSVDAAQAEALSQSDPLAHLAEMALAPLRLLAGNPHLQRVFHIAMHFTEYTDDLAAVQQRQLEGTQRYQQMLAQVLDIARLRGEVAADLPVAETATGLFALVDGLMHHWTVAPGLFDLARVGPVAVGAYVGGLRIGPPPARASAGERPLGQPVSAVPSASAAAEPGV
jgi:TetR/AcrR family transcriptional regulator, acrAB operon repressor